MKKRILIFTVVATMLMTMLALPTFADEAVKDYVDGAHYYFTLRVGQELTFHGNDLLSTYTDSNMTITGHGKYTSGKDAGLIQITNGAEGLYRSKWGIQSQEYFAGNIAIGFGGNVAKGHPGVFVNTESGVIQSISGTTVNNTPLYDSITVKFNDYYLDENGDKVDNKESVDEMIKSLTRLGIEVHEVTYGGLVETIFDGFGAAIGGLAGGLKTSFNRIVYANGIGGEFSPLVIFIFVMAGLGLATAILYKIFGMVRRRKG